MYNPSVYPVCVMVFFQKSPCCRRLRTTIEPPSPSSRGDAVVNGDVVEGGRFTVKKMKWDACDELKILQKVFSKQKVEPVVKDKTPEVAKPAVETH
uniref:Uncharacterized protein n=1 Tax=Leersia perrieri TaxID=77586 RepID=A0A0D9VWC0_9ORYZ